MNEQVAGFREALESLDRVGAHQIFQDALKVLSPSHAVEQFIIPALSQIGDAWEKGDLALSQVYLCGRFCEEMVDRVLPPSDPDRKQQPRSAIVVLNDHHMLGQRIVYSTMRASGFEIFNYGRMDVKALVDRALQDRLQVLLISVLMLPSALKVGEVCQQLKTLESGIRVVVGGAPFLFDSELWQEVGADAMGRNAADAITIVSSWMGGKP